MNLENHMKEITRLRHEADQHAEDNPGGLMQKIDLLAKCLVFVGRVSSHLDGYYKQVYNERKRVHAQAYIDSPSPKQAHAELAVVELRELEAQAYEDMRRWRNALDGLTEEIHALKLKMRINFADGGSDV